MIAANNGRFNSADEDFLQFPESFDTTSPINSVSPNTGQPRPGAGSLPAESSKAITDTGAFELQNIAGKPASLFLQGQYIDIVDIKRFGDHFQSSTSRGFGGDSAVIVSTLRKNNESTAQVSQILGRKKVATNVVQNIDASQVSRAPQKIINI
jgi:hypothetical protein